MIGEYEVIEKLGSGAMGDVYKARHPVTNEQFAIKILSEELSNNPRALERFKREVRQSIQLKHPNLIAAYSEGEFRGRRYYVMEFVDGVTAKKELLSRGPFDELRVLEIMIQICKALEYAAQHNIIHRDIKPDNIMITYDGKAKLCDMGLAKSMVESNEKVTLLGTVLGTPQYMSPEQAKGEENLDTRSDLFSLGATWYHLVTGYAPFEGQEPLTIMNALINEEPVPIQDRNPKVSDAICAVIAKMMVKDRDKRYQNFTELLEDLYRLKKREPTTAEQSITLPVSKLKQQKFDECFVPSEDDVLVLQIAMHNKIVNAEQVETCLIRQECLALIGISLDASSVMLEQQFISPQQKMALDRARMIFVLDRGDDIFFKVVSGSNLLDKTQLQEFVKLKQQQQKGISGILVAKNIMTEEKREKIYASVKHAMTQEEGRNLLKSALENNLMSRSQIEKCSRIYSNNIVMGKYRDMGSIILEKNFLVPEAFQALLRAIRRNILTGKPVVQYLNSVRTK